MIDAVKTAAEKPSAKAKKPVVFAIDDEQSNLDLIKRALRSYDVELFVDPMKVLEYDAKEPAALIVDYRMPQVDGVTLVRKLRERGIACGALMVTAYPELDELVYAQQANLFYRIVPKPFAPEALCRYVDLVLAEGLIDAELGAREGVFAIEVLSQKSFAKKGRARAGDSTASRERVGRIPVNGEVRLRVGGKAVNAVLDSVSLGGMGMVGDLDVSIGGKVRVESVVLGGGTFPIAVDCVVAWCKPDKPGRMAVGLRFEPKSVSWGEIEPIMRQAYACYLAGQGS
jgi:two-component system, OmpR family, response regulator